MTVTPITGYRCENGHDACGQPQQGPGAPKRGWYNFREGGKNGYWFCSVTCLARYLSTMGFLPRPKPYDFGPDVPPHVALHTLNRLAHRCVPLNEVTKEKVQRLLDLAFDNLVNMIENEEGLFG